MKQRFEHTTKSERIEWTVTLQLGRSISTPEKAVCSDRDSRTKLIKETKAVFYILKPEYHGHPWTACAAVVTPQAEVINTYAFAMDKEQVSAMQKALAMASRFAAGKRLKGTKLE